jgi:hypothetical protein
MPEKQKAAPGWFKGTRGEWNAIPQQDRVEMANLPAASRDTMAARCLAIVRNEAYNPDAATQYVPAANAKLDVFVGIRNWNEDVPPHSAERMRNCIIFLLDVQKDPWYRANCSNRAFVRRNADKMDASTPENFDYRDTLLKTHTRHIDGEQHPVVQRIIARKPANEAERKRIREEIGDPETNPYVVKWLAKDDCQKCKGDGYRYVSQYPGDPVNERLELSVVCDCVKE